MTHRSPPQGFTIIELTIVIVILGVLFLILVKWPDTDPNLYAEARKIASDLRYLQHLAQTQHQRYRINFTSNSYSFSDLNNTTPIVHSANNQSTQTLASDITLSTTLPNNYLVFNEQGVPYVDNVIPGTTLNSTATITLNAGGHVQHITIYPDTGAVVVSS